MLEIATCLGGTGKQTHLLWQMTHQSAGQRIDRAASGCDLCLPFLSHLKGEVSGIDRVMYKSSAWLVTPRWALSQPSSFSPCKNTGRGGLWCEMMERRIQRVDLYSKKPRHVYNNSQLWLGWNFYLSCPSLIKFHILKWLLWHCTLELKCDMKGAHFSA